MKKVVFESDLPRILDISYTPTPTGNTVGLGQFVKDVNGDLYYIDRLGVSVPFGSGNGTAFKTIVEKSDTFTCSADTKVFNHYKLNSDTVPIEVVLPKSTEVEDGYRIEFNRNGNNSCSIVPQSGDTVNNYTKLLVPNNSFYELTLLGKDWVVTVKETDSVQGDITHFVGFFVNDYGVLCVDIVSMSDVNVNIDVSKYNLEYDDGNTSWSIVSGAVDLKKVADTSLKFNIG